MKTEENNNSINRAAKIISYIFDGSFISIPIILIICLMIIDNKIEAISWAFVCLLFGTVIPYLYICFLFRKKEIKDMHIPTREDRTKPLLLSCASYAACLGVLYVLDAPLFLKSLFMVIAASAIIYTIITYFWKISLHSSWITFIVITFNILFGRWMLLMVPLIPVVGWARVRIKKHTVNQVLFGAGISSLTSLLIYYGYGFIRLF